MRKAVVTLASIAAALCLMLTGCTFSNYQIDTTYRFDYAIIALPNGQIVEGECEGWTDYEDGDQIQIKIDGTTYLVHSANATLIANSKNK